MRPWQRITAAGLYPADRLIGTDDLVDPDPRQVSACRLWIRLYGTPTKTIRRRRGSYALKHAVEAWTRAIDRNASERLDENGCMIRSGGMYIANGAFIEAARLEGYRIVRTYEESPNAHFNMSTRTPR